MSTNITQLTLHVHSLLPQHTSQTREGLSAESKTDLLCECSHIRLSIICRCKHKSRRVTSDQIGCATNRMVAEPRRVTSSHAWWGFIQHHTDMDWRPHRLWRFCSVLQMVWKVTETHWTWPSCSARVEQTAGCGEISCSSFRSWWVFWWWWSYKTA